MLLNLASFRLCSLPSRQVVAQYASLRAEGLSGGKKQFLDLLEHRKGLPEVTVRRVIMLQESASSTERERRARKWCFLVSLENPQSGMRVCFGFTDRHS